MKKTLIFLVVLIVALAATFATFLCRNESGNVAEAINNPNEPGGKYLSDLLTAIYSADEITVTEHSSMVDYLRPERNPDDYKEKSYTVVIVSPSEKRELIEIVGALKTKTQEAFPACIFDPHHRIALYSKGKLASTMELCFECGQIEWDGTRQTPPWSIYGGMKTFIAGIGLHPKAEWWAKYDGVTSSATQGIP
jgi:hypothetical protein